MIRVLANGCFDGLHLGHVKHLQAASGLGDQLIVGLTADRHVNKGPGRPVFTWNERCDMLSALKFVSSVYLVVSGEHAIKLVEPDIFVKGAEYRDKDIPEAKLCEAMGIKMVFLDTSPVYSSTDLLSGKTLRERVAAIRIGE